MIDKRDIESLLPKAREISAGLSFTQFNQQPAPGAWSVGQCLVHLNTVDGLYAAVIRDAIDNGGRTGTPAEGPAKIPLLERLFVRLLEPPYRLKFKAPQNFKPVGTEHDPDRVFSEWDRAHRRLLQLADETSGLDVLQVKVNSPAAPVQISLLGTFAVVAAHDRRHLWQAQQVRGRLGF